MKVIEIAAAVDANIIQGKANEEKKINYGFASDLMSDVLTLNADNILLITGLCNIQTIRTAEMANIEVILFARGKQVSEDMVQEAKENDIVLLQVFCFQMFRPFRQNRLTTYILIYYERCNAYRIHCS